MDAIRAEQEATHAAPMFSSATDAADKAMLTMLQTAYFIAKEDVAILKFEKLTNLLERCQCPHLPRTLYRNRDGCHELVTIIGNYLESEVVQLMRESPYIGLMIDVSTDLSVRKNLVIYVNVFHKGNVETLFADLCEMKQCDASALTEAIVQYLNNKNIDVEKISGLEVTVCLLWLASILE